ncbi:hypothetical protein O181_045004 [Austropuccinia psidii MF-1]|uniref:Uncharacterized protein n=1 Tax=Austropuccinia psidii MF-1 TaxID=1389203 RepID=A0A9Q3DLC3_9BASI|nr:hypothetical protein [Austropuccinia psidii MF-1]
MVMGVLKNTPISFLKHDSGLNSLLTSHSTHCHRTLARLIAKDNSNPERNIFLPEFKEKKSPYQSEIQQMVGKEIFEKVIDTQLKTMNLYPINPWFNPLETHNLNKEKNKVRQSVRDHISNTKLDEIIVFTDGSDIPGNGKREAAVLHSSRETLTKNSDKETRVLNYEMEITGVSLEMEGIRGEIFRRTLATGDKDQQDSIIILSDNVSQGLLGKTSMAWSSGIKNSLRELQRNKEINGDYIF